MIGLILALIIIAHYLNLLSGVEKGLRFFLFPGSKFFYETSLEAGDIKFSSEQEMISAYEELKNRYIALETEVTKNKTIEEDNKILREQLNFLSQNKNLISVGANVVGKNIDPVGSVIILDRGQKDGIRVGNPVIHGNGVIVGKILKTEEEMSVAILLNDGQSRVAATIVNFDKSLGIVEGFYDISIRMSYIPQNEKISVGDQVITSGLETGIPRGLIIGAVESVEKEMHDPFQTAIVKPIFDLKKIPFVSVLIAS